SLAAELQSLSKEQGFELASNVIDDVLTYALFPQVGLKFLKNRGSADAFEPPPDGKVAAPAPERTPAGPAVYSVRVSGKEFTVEVAESDPVTSPATSSKPVSSISAQRVPATRDDDAVKAMLSGNICKVMVKIGDTVTQGQPCLVVEAMKMETEVISPRAGEITEVFVREGDA
ncbi:MAG: oxaloacetate decarboxylase, partial [Rhodobacteraceae bacterium]|nr:oxaloacetate decarboxylase [Paracoccaceae bacterium]